MKPLPCRNPSSPAASPFPHQCKPNKKGEAVGGKALVNNPGGAQSLKKGEAVGGKALVINPDTTQPPRPYDGYASGGGGGVAGQVSTRLSRLHHQ